MGESSMGPTNQTELCGSLVMLTFCNGVLEGSNYFYVSTMFFPYFLGCFGPGNMAYGLSVSCSSNARYCSSGASDLLKSMIIAVISVAAITQVL
jgi:hypothetical protein